MKEGRGGGYKQADLKASKLLELGVLEVYPMMLLRLINKCQGALCR